MSCKECEQRGGKKGGVFNANCPVCRTALALNEPCKKKRAVLVERLINRWGEVEGWKAEPHCGCERYCKMHRRIREESYR